MQGPDALRPQFLRDYDAWYTWISEKPGGLFGFLSRTIESETFDKNGANTKQLWQFARKLVEAMPVDAGEAAISKLRSRIVDAADDIKAGRAPGATSR